jgi:hypothetical protein
MTTIEIPSYAWVIVLLAIWELLWKGFALWKSAKSNDKIWYIVILIFNTAGILPILYLFVFSKRESVAKKVK